jgi:membrane-bound lytic murein transglycosylase A
MGFHAKIYLKNIFIVTIISIWITGCAVPKKPTLITRVEALRCIRSFQYPDFSDDMAYDGLEHAILKSISYLEKLPSNQKFLFGKDSYSADHMIKSLQRFSAFVKTNPSKNDLKKFIKSHYRVYRTVGRDQTGQVLFTGYFEPILEGSLSKSDAFPFSIYARPDDLLIIDLSPFSPKYSGETVVARYFNQTVMPYHDRREIEFEGALEGKADHIAWIKDRIDLFFLQIQGSGKIYLDNGDLLHVHYHGTNGRPYRSIGKLLIDEGKIPRAEMSMQKIRNYLNDHPEDIQRILSYNPSYVFFKTETEGPLGCINVKLTPGRSIATDRRIFPQAALAFIETKKPLISGEGRIQKWMDLSRFALNQDTGGAIRGPGRADLFWGNGIYAEIAAGHLQHPGKLYFLILKPDV